MILVRCTCCEEDVIVEFKDYVCSDCSESLEEVTPLPCPHPDCLSETAALFQNEEKAYYFVMCPECEMEGPPKDEAYDAVDAWNGFFRG